MSHLNTYDIGDVVRLSATFTDLVGDPVDPAGGVFKVLDPNGAVATPAPVVMDAAGQYHADFPVALAGVHVYRAEGTGANAAAAEARFEARRSPVLEAEAA